MTRSGSRPATEGAGFASRVRRMLGDAPEGETMHASMLEWLRASLTRRVVLLAIGLVLTILFQVSALVAIPDAAFIVFGVWLLAALALFVGLHGHAASTHVWRVHMVAQAVDVVGTLTLSHLLGATLWYAPLILAMSISLGGQTLPRLNAFALGLIAAVGYAVTVMAEVRGIWPVTGPFAPSEMPSDHVAIAAIIIVGVLLVAIATIQRGFYRQITAIEQRHARLLEAARDIIVTIDSDGRFVSANAAIEEQLGWTREKIIGDQFIGLVDEPDRARALDEFSRVLRGATIKTDIHVQSASGQSHLVSVTGAPILDEHGRVVAALGIGRDVTAQREDASRLIESERQLRLLVRSVNETVFTVDTDLRFTAIYGRWAPDAPLKVADVVGKSVEEVLGEKFGAALTRPMERALTGERVEIEQDLAVGTEMRCFRVSFTPLQEDDGRIVGVTGAAFDISEQRRAEHERDALRGRLEESRRSEALGRLVSGVAHEINNPLTAIIAFAEQLRADARTPMDSAALEAIHAQAMRSRAIVRDLIAFALPGTHRPVTEVRPGPLIDGTLRTLLPHLMSLGVELTTDVRDDEVWVAADAPGLEQVITNLVLNAAQATGARGSVMVRTQTTPTTFSVIVEDSGPGIRVDVLPHLFEPFYTTKPVGQGTGLGLFVARGIMQRHGGALRAENRAQGEGGGARFVMEVPRAMAPMQDSAPASETMTPESTAMRPRSAPAPRPSGPRLVVPRQTPTPAPVAGLGPGRVLLVDDEESIRVSIGRYFTRRGWTVVGASDGAEALALLREGGPDSFTMILCDLRMPGMGGAELHAQLKIEEPSWLERLVLVSGDIVSTDAAAFVATTQCRLLEKPFELKVLGGLADEMLMLQKSGGAAETPPGHVA